VCRREGETTSPSWGRHADRTPGPRRASTSSYREKRGAVMSRASMGRAWAVARGAILLALQAGTSSRRVGCVLLVEPDPLPIEMSSAEQNVDCDIIGAALDSLYANARHPYLLLRDLTSADIAPDVVKVPINEVDPSYRRRMRGLRRSLGVDSTTTNSFALENSAPTPVCRTPRSRVPVWILQQSSDVRAAIHVRQPVELPSSELEYPGVITVSRAGMSADGRQALLEVSNVCGGLCGAGWLVVLNRDNDGRWRVRRAIMLWVS